MSLQDKLLVTNLEFETLLTRTFLLKYIYSIIQTVLNPQALMYQKETFFSWTLVALLLVPIFLCCVCVCVCVFSFHWRIIALQSSGDLCHTSTQISHNYKYMPSLLSLPPASFHTFKVLAEQQACLPVLYSRLYVNATLSSCLTFSFPCCVHQTILYICVSISSL